jgi:hypothetical protein
MQTPKHWHPIGYTDNKVLIRPETGHWGASHTAREGEARGWEDEGSPTCGLPGP